MDLIKDKHRVESSLDLKKQLESWMPLLDLGNAYPLYVSFTTEKEMNNITNRMLRFYFGVILKQIISWNAECGELCYKGTERPIVDVNTLDYYFRGALFFEEVESSKCSIKTAKTLKLDKANRKEACEYFELLIDVMAEKKCFIETRELNDIKSLIGV